MCRSRCYLSDTVTYVGRGDCPCKLPEYLVSSQGNRISSIRPEYLLTFIVLKFMDALHSFRVPGSGVLSSSADETCTLQISATGAWRRCRTSIWGEEGQLVVVTPPQTILQHGIPYLRQCPYNRQLPNPHRNFHNALCVASHSFLSFRPLPVNFLRSLFIIIRYHLRRNKEGFRGKGLREARMATNLCIVRGTVIRRCNPSREAVCS